MPEQQPTPSLAEYRRMEAEDDNTFWRLQSGDHQNLLEEAIEEIDRLQAELDEQRHYGEQLQMSLDSCSGRHLEIAPYEPEEARRG